MTPVQPFLLRFLFLLSSSDGGEKKKEAQSHHTPTRFNTCSCVDLNRFLFASQRPLAFPSVSVATAARAVPTDGPRTKTYGTGGRSPLLLLLLVGSRVTCPIDPAVSVRCEIFRAVFQFCDVSPQRDGRSPSAAKTKTPTYL